VNTQPLPEQPADDITFTDDEIIEKARNAKNGPKFKLLFDYGDTGDYGGDQSRADLALCDLIAFWTQDVQQIYRVFERSALMRSKWNRRDYAMRTIEKSLEQLSNETTPETDAGVVDMDIYERALDIHKNGDPVKFILDTFNTLHIGDRAPATGILCGFGCQCCTNTKGLQPSVFGESGYGKSQLVKAMCHLAPPKYILHETLTEAGLYNMRDELIPGMTIFSDDVELSKELAGTLKRSTSEYQEKTARRLSEVKVGTKKFESVKQLIPERIMWLLTSVDQTGGVQVAKRQLSFGVDESDEHQKIVIAFEMEKAKKGLQDFPVNADVLTCRELLRIMREKDFDGTPRLFSVAVPDLNVSWNDTKNSRNLSMFLDLIKSFAVLRFMQRDTDETGNLIANDDDIDAALRLYLQYAQTQIFNLTTVESRMFNFIMERGEATTHEIMDRLKIQQPRVWKLGNSLLEKVPGLKVRKETISQSDDDDAATRRSTSINIYSFDRNYYRLDDYESVVTRKEGGDKDEIHN
jgi:energy-coupling factor transporter ATP-binding protein EcfA2